MELGLRESSLPALFQDVNLKHPKDHFQVSVNFLKRHKDHREAVKTSGFFYHKFQTYDTFQKC